MQNNPGFNPELAEEHASEEDYHFLGAKLPREIIRPDGDWSESLPRLEVQRNRFFDTYSCTNFANCNANEMMHKARYGEEIDNSDWYSANISGTKYGVGNSHTRVGEATRKGGYVNETDLPFTSTTTKAKYFGPISQSIKEIGLKWVVESEYGYENVPRKNYDEALKFSPIQVAVDSRTNKTAKVGRYDHSVVLYKKDSVKKKNYIFDSYLGKIAEYDWDYPFAYGMRFHYKKIINIIIDDMKMQLVRNKEDGKIYMIDSDGRKHHVEGPDDFIKYFGNIAWTNKDWVDVSQAGIDSYGDGISLSAKKTSFAEAITSLFKKFGKKNNS